MLTRWISFHILRFGGELLYPVFKRICDIIISLTSLILLCPIMLVIAVIIRLDSDGGALFCQNRVGKDGRLFRIYKFRTMTGGSGDTEWVSDSSRVTRVGKFLRDNFIDELPQLINVLKGEMSLVGPRPERPFFTEKFSAELPDYPLRHAVLPGITGWAQVNGWRGDTSIEKRLECDLFYIKNKSFFLDIKILFLTLLIKPRGK